MTQHLMAPGMIATPVGMGLVSLERDNADPDAILAVLAPGMPLTAEPDGVTASAHGTVLHRQYRLLWSEWPLHGGRMAIHVRGDKLLGVSVWLPDLVTDESTFPLPAPSIPALGDVLAMSPLGWSINDIIRQEETLFVLNGRLTAAWRIVRGESANAEEAIIQGSDGSILARRTLHFDAAEADVYETNPNSPLVRKPLTDVDDSGFLHNGILSVFGPDGESRVQSATGLFVFPPTDEVSFDQSQAWYTATRMMTWVRETWGDAVTLSPVKILVQSGNAGDRIDARYMPSGPQGDATIFLGVDGVGGLRNFATDSDVLIHELGHHTLYQFVQSNEGESAALHEGFADFLAYAVNGDPCLGETISANACLRTAALPASERYDDPRIPTTKYRRGQIWSAVLWELLQTTGRDILPVVGESWHYLSSETTVREALMGLLSADRDLYPRTSGTRDADVFGRHKCDIINAATARGMAPQLQGIDASDCAVDIPTLIEQSKTLATTIVAAQKKKGPGPAKNQDLIDFGPLCGVTGTHTGPASTWILMLPALTVLGFALMARRPRRQTTSSQETSHGT